MLTRAMVLGEFACESVIDEVLRLRDRWVRRGTAQFFTLGAASYLDDAQTYNTRAVELNRVLLASFAPLYQQLQARLSDVLAAPVTFAEGKAVPGFHIWGVPGIPTEACASLHFDLQYQKLTWPPSARDAAWRSISFTLPFRLPRLGGGLTVWDLSYERVQAFFARTGFEGSLDDLCVLATERHEPYTAGELVLHSGHVLHRIAPIARVEADDLRLTLQGHGLFFDGRWHVYW